MTAPDPASWADALTMYERRYSIVTVGPRRHQDWVLDAAAILRKETSDPRSWKSQEFYQEDDEEWRPDRLVPFLPTDSGWRARLTEIPRSSAERLLVAISTNWLDVTKEPDFEARRPALEEKARVLLARFPAPTAQFFTNGSYGPGDPPDFYHPITGCDPFSEHDWDVGLLAVSKTELGIFWSFDAT
ncbi:hypothetical protein K4B79_19580 [Streptomyces lincolnensis]|uniref:hypothetical protein n=1 Tax=Streptomyces lincolnensis TaxID=1915 RepID=UPI001E3C3C21|nr:hypothetical protein [Streptomyces lincolnensis]MCD7440414.1 hypothetical protein [Streptomyces lincolnensis]